MTNENRNPKKLQLIPKANKGLAPAKITHFQPYFQKIPPSETPLISFSQGKNVKICKLILIL